MKSLGKGAYIKSHSKCAYIKSLGKCVFIKSLCKCVYIKSLGNEKAEETEERLKSETDTTLGKLVKQVIVSFLKAFLRLVGCRTYFVYSLRSVKT